MWFQVIDFIAPHRLDLFKIPFTLFPLMPAQPKLYWTKRARLVRTASRGKISALCRQYAISRTTFYKWKKRYDESKKRHGNPYLGLRAADGLADDHGYLIEKCAINFAGLPSAIRAGEAAALRRHFRPKASKSA